MNLDIRAIFIVENVVISFSFKNDMWSRTTNILCLHRRIQPYLPKLITFLSSLGGGGGG